MKKLLLLLFLFASISLIGQTHYHVFQNQLPKNVKVQIPSQGINLYLGPNGTKNSTSQDYSFSTDKVDVVITPDHEVPIRRSINLNDKYIVVNDYMIKEVSQQGPNKEYYSKEASTKSKPVVIVNTSGNKVTGKTGFAKGITLSPGAEILDNYILLNKETGTKYDFRSNKFLDSRNSEITPETAHAELDLYNSSAQIAWLTEGEYETNWQVFTGQKYEEEGMVTAMILQSIIKDKTKFIVIDSSTVKKFYPSGDERRRLLRNRSNTEIHVMVGGEKKVLSPRKGRKFEQVRLDEKLRSGYYYVSVSLITGGKAIARDLLILVAGKEKTVDIDSQIVKSAINAGITSQAVESQNE